MSENSGVGPQFSELTIRGYRRLRDVTLQLRPMNVLIGANGVGKTSVIEVVSMLAHSAKGLLETTLSNSGGLYGVLTRDGRTQSISFGLELQSLDESPLRYSLELLSSGIGYVISNETLVNALQGSEAGTFPGFDHLREVTQAGKQAGLGAATIGARANHKPLETALHRMEQSQDTVGLFHRLLSTSDAIFRPIDVSMRSAVRLPQTLQPAQTPGVDGSLLYACLYSLRETNRPRFDAIEDTLRAAFPGFEQLSLPSVAMGSLILAWKEAAFAQAVYPFQLSEGTLRFLWLVTLLQSPGLPPITLIDEPEVSLHPELLRLLVELMREASQRTQLIVATHSDLLVRFLKPEELVICDVGQDGGTEIKRGSDLDLEAWLADYSLDQLWRMGRLGGRA